MAKGEGKDILFKAVGILIGITMIFSYGLIRKGRVPSTPAKPPAASQPFQTTSGAAAIMDAFAKQVSGVQVEAAGSVKEILPSDTPGVKHQKFIIALDNAHTLLLAHDTDIAPAVPAKVGDRLEFRGQYEWNDKGGIIHWTHHDPDMKHPDGWVKLDGKAYR